MELLQVCLWLHGGRGEIGCVTVITNLAKVRGKQTEQEKLEWSDDSFLQLPPALICSGNSPQNPLIPCMWLNFNASLMRLEEKTTYLSTQMDWKADARSKWQVISALASFKWNLYAFLAACSYAVTAHLSYGSSHLQHFLSYRADSPPSLISTCDLSNEVFCLFKWVLHNPLLHKMEYREMK